MGVIVSTVVSLFRTLGSAVNTFGSGWRTVSSVVSTAGSVVSKLGSVVSTVGAVVGFVDLRGDVAAFYPYLCFLYLVYQFKERLNKQSAETTTVVQNWILIFRDKQFSKHGSFKHSSTNSPIQ